MESLRKAVFLTAANRPEYFRKTLASWENVRYQDDWMFIIRLEPTERLDEMLEIAEGFKSFPHILHVNESVIGAPRHPWVAFEESFHDMYRDYTVSVEDDLPVSDDFLEYHRWAAQTYYLDPEIATVSSFSKIGSNPSAVNRRDGFVSWGFGTWWDRWEDYISPTWDGNYSTFETVPGDRSGWDWNLNLRVLPSMQKKTIFPEVSRIQNIGTYGVHGTAENFVQSSCFSYHQDPASFIEK
jgi:hypothetical protein